MESAIDSDLDMKRVVVAGALAVAVTLAPLPTWLPQALADGAACTISGSGKGAGVLVNGVCVPVDPETPGGQHGPPTKTITCGKNIPGSTWNPECGGQVRECYEVRPGQGNVQLDAQATLTLRNGKWGDPQVWCPGKQQPVVTEAAIREHALQLLPHVEIGTAWKHTALVNAEVVLWADTTIDRNLGTVTVVNQPVAIRASFAHADWDFGDGTHEQPTDPGKPYDRHDPCNTSQCRDYYGHTYTRTGQVTITLTVTWTAQYRIGTGDWTDLADPLTGDPRTTPLTLVQARGVLVPNPDH